MGDPGIIRPVLGPGTYGYAGVKTPSGGQVAAAALGHNFGPAAFAPPALGAGPLQDISQLNQIDVKPRTWTRFHVTRPTILISLNSTIVGGTAQSGAQAPIYYCPNYQPDVSIATTTAAMKVAQVSRGCGTVYLPQAGWWSIYWDRSGTTAPLSMLQIDASDPAVAARYLFEEGIHDFSVNTSITVTVGSTTLLASNRLRKGFYLCIDTPAALTNAVRLAFGDTAPATTLGLKLGITGQQFTFGMSGENCYKGAVSAIRDSAALADVPVSVLEWY